MTSSDKMFSCKVNGRAEIPRTLRSVEGQKYLEH